MFVEPGSDAMYSIAAQYFEILSFGVPMLFAISSVLAFISDRFCVTEGHCYPIRMSK